MPRPGLKVLNIVIRWGALAAMVLAIYFFVNNAQFWLRAESTTGVVVGQEVREASRENRGTEIEQTRIRPESFAPYITFGTGTGEEVTFLSNIAYGKNFAFHTGDEVPVLFLRSNPDKAKVNSLVELFVLPVVLFLFAGVFWIFGVVVQYLAEPSSKRETDNPARPDS